MNRRRKGRNGLLRVLALKLMPTSSRCGLDRRPRSALRTCPRAARSIPPVSAPGLERVRVDHRPFAPPRVRDETGLLDALQRRHSRIARAAVHTDDLSHARPRVRAHQRQRHLIIGAILLLIRPWLQTLARMPRAARDEELPMISRGRYSDLRAVAHRRGLFRLHREHSSGAATIADRAFLGKGVEKIRRAGSKP